MDLFREGDDEAQALEDLVEALDADLDWRDDHARLTVRAREWARSGRDRSRLLRGSELKAAEEWSAHALDHPKTPPTPAHLEYVRQSRKAADRAARTWRVALSAGLALSLALAGLALVKEIQATQEARVAQSNAYAAEATVDLSTDPLQSISLALRSSRLDQSSSAEQALRLALADSRFRVVVSSGDGSAAVAAWDPARPELALTAPGSVELWDARTGRMLQSLSVPGQYFDGEQVEGVQELNRLSFDPAGAFLAAVSGAGYVAVWRLSSSGTATAVPTATLDSDIRADAGSRPPDPLLEISSAWDTWRSSSVPGRWWAGGASSSTCGAIWTTC